MKTLSFVDENNGAYPAWETKQLGEVAEVVGGGTPSTSVAEYWHGDVQWFSPTDIGEPKFVSTSSRKITEAGLKASSAKIMPVGTVLLTTRASLGRMAILKVPASTNQGFQSLIPGNQTISDYLYYLQPQISAYCDLKASGSTFKEISGKEIRNMPIPLPSLAEQQRIAEFFSALDERIELQAEKVALLREQKRGFQQRVFSGDMAFTDDNGNPYPAWEQKTLGELTTLTSGKIKKSTLDGDVYNLTMGSVTREGNLSPKDKTKTKSDLLEPNDLIMPTRDIGVGLVIGKTAIIPDDGNIYSAGNCLFVLKTKENALFLSYAINNGKARKKMQERITGSAQLMIKISDVTTLPIDLPSLPEQQRIAEFFSALDENIALNERKLELLKEQKKGYLQGIFG